jgi:hypothetical protein
MRHTCVLVAVIGTMLAIGVAAQAAPLNLVQGYPDIQTISNSVNYSSATDQFTDTGRPIIYSVPTQYNITNTTITSYSLIATINDSGVATGGTLTIGGKIGVPINAATGTLLTGSLFAFGNGNTVNGDPFEFIFTVTGGDLAAAMGPQVGVIISAKSTNFTDWTHDFTGGSTATNDTFRIPEPASLMLLGLSGLAMLRRRQVAQVK